MSPGPAAALARGALPPAVANVVRSGTAAFIVLQDGLSDAELELTFEALSRARCVGGLATFVMPALAVPWFPFPAGDLTGLDGRPFHPPADRAADRYLFEAVFLPSLLRLSIGFGDARRRLRRVLLALVRALLLYGYGRFAVSEASLRQSAREAPGLAAAMPELEAWLADEALESDARTLVALGSAVAERLQLALLEHAARRDDAVEASPA